MSIKRELSIKIVSKRECDSLLKDNHYLSQINKGFKSGVNYGLFHNDSLIGVSIFTGFPVPELVVGLFGLERTQQEGFYELSRFCLDPFYQKTEHNLSSWFLSRAIKLLRKSYNVRAILSYADEDFHNGTLYKACNFKYYGLTSPKKDFYIKEGDSFRKLSRGGTKGLEGEWRNRSRKHRFLMLFDKSLNVKWEIYNE